MELDAHGTRLWNLSTQLRRDEDVSARLQLTICLLRIFAFYLLDSGYSEKAGGVEQRVRLLKVALKAGKAGLGQGELDVGSKVLERAAHYVGLLSEGSADAQKEDEPLIMRLTGEYHVLRIAMVRSPFQPLLSLLTL